METQQAKIKVEYSVLPFLNIPLFLNAFAFIPILTIQNNGFKIDALELLIEADTPCIESFKFNIEGLLAETEISIPTEKIIINRNYISQLSETEKSLISITVKSGGELLFKEETTILVQPLEYFAGIQSLPELLASYITPNHPYIYHIKRRAIEILEKHGQHTAFEAYQSNNPERVLQMMSAIYTAIQDEQIVYSALPPGYEQTGQRLRLLNTIQQERFGNCIDISLLIAACYEAIGLHPIIILVHGHAFVGCWLTDDKLNEVINDDKTAITKRLSKGIREMAAVEATSVCKGNNIPFTDALNRGESQLVEKDDFQMSIDVKRARIAGIRPLPLLTSGTTVALDEEAVQAINHHVETEFQIGPIYEDELLHGKRQLTKQKLWERKLLDLSLRNSLLNLRMTRNMLQLVDIDISQLEDTLSDGKSFSIMPAPRAEVLRKYNLFNAVLHHSSPIYQMANDDLKYSRLHTYYHQQDLDNILTYIHKNAKSAIEENGSSTLYLAVGLLKWFDRKTPDQPRYAPILLIPVEISRRSVNSKFTLKSREEETMVNITLLEFLRQEYQLNLAGLEQLPMDEKGVDVPKVMGHLRRAIMQLKGWDVEEQLVLGNFSFSKLILWKDIVQHQDELLNSDMVRSLIEGKISFEQDNAGINDIDLDALQSASLTLPISTDVSQMEAVLTAQEGNNFILHGPPGTGKSQTITNIIADALYHGKRVLFVAAKKAALDVVYKRMEQIGLAPFSLELHSNKSKKSDVLEQLSKSIDTAKLLRSRDFVQEAQRLDDAKRSISSYVNLLHKKQPIGWSLYHSIVSMEDYSNRSIPHVNIPINTLHQLNALLWQQWNDWLPQFVSITSAIIHPKENQLAVLQLQEYTPTVQQELVQQTRSMMELLPNMQQQMQSLVEALHFPFAVEALEDWEHFMPLVQLLQAFPNISLQLSIYLADKDNHTVYEDWGRHFGNYQTALKQMLAQCSRSILQADISAIEMLWKQAKQTWFLPKWLKKRSIKKQLNIYANNALSDDAAIEQMFSLNNQLQDTKQLFQQQRFSELTRALKGLFKDEETDLPDINLKAISIQQLGNAASYFGKNALSKWLASLDAAGFDDLEEIRKRNKTTINNSTQLASLFAKQWDSYQTLTGIVFHQKENWVENAVMQLRQLENHLHKLKDWINYVQLCKQAKQLQLQWLIVAYEKNVIETSNLVDCFHYSTHTAIAQQIISEHEPLSMFNTQLFESKVEQYKKTAKLFKELTIQELRIKLSAQLPNTTVEAMQSSEIGILQKAIKSRGRGTSIRKLFDQLPTLLPRLAPCMLMSPISVAQYFDVNTKHFDLVIFDEASQLPTCEAVSALARAKQAIIVGDPKQMPPTAFFSTNKVDEEDTEVEDLESILDDCLALSIPSKYLLRHYRSKHESLIAFSNANYYDNKLLTFPSADDLNRKVKYHHVPGHYDKGKTRTNRFEADAIAQYIKAHYKHPQKRKLSLGVVTFSQTQMSLVEERIEELFRNDAALEQMANESAEPLFIKNLENVQGDERDIILFSICYAPDEQGSMSMNFGPLNRDGGWRRLNVAITRARYEMHVFATLNADQIDLNRTAAQGVAGLKGFLHYAEKGNLTFRAGDVQANQDEKHLSTAIGKRLQEKGLNIKCNIGTSGFKIDVGIVHPAKPDEYILGIVLDGHYYYHAKTMNDREMVMPSVLKMLGWNILRIWTMDWYENSNTIIENIVAKVAQLQQEQHNSTEATTIEILEEAIIEPFQTAPIFETETITITSKQLPYIAHALTPVPHGNSESMYDFRHRNAIKVQMQHVVNMESPISKGLLYKRVLQAWNTSRAGARLDKHLESIISEMSFSQSLHHQPFYWSAGTIAAEYNNYRNNDTEKRSIEDIAPEEIIVALHEVVSNNLSIEEEELLRYLARTFGFAKVGKQIDTLLRYAIDLAERNGKVRKEGGRVKVND